MRATKGKTYEEIYGVEKAKELKELRRQNAIAKDLAASTRGKTYEEIYSPEKAKQMREVRSGENHWLWNPDKEYFRGEDWLEARKFALERDKYICQDCGKTNKLRMDVHHLIPWEETHDNRLENLITLCRSCHIKREKPYLHTKPISQQTREKHSKRMKLYWAEPENLRKAAERMKGNKISPNLPHGSDGRFITKDK